MIKTETVIIENYPFTHTWSDAGFYISRDGSNYVEAYDPAEFNREYTETDVPVETEEDENEYEEAGKILMGVE